jgi:hypothetical protein
MSDWRALERELDGWRKIGRRASFWWRDDDATDAPPALHRLLALAQRHDLPLALAVVPAAAAESLVDAIGPWRRIAVLQHGYAHRNHAPPAERKAELGAHRPLSKILDELRLGRRRLGALFGKRLAPILVPPWNRIDEAVVRRLTGLGFIGLSTFQARDRPDAAPGLRQVNCHIDLMDWRSRAFLGRGTVLDSAIGHLAARREGRIDGVEPTGLMSHHLAHDDAAWRFLEQFLAATANHPAARWLTVRQAFQRRARPG